MTSKQQLSKIQDTLEALVREYEEFHPELCEKIEQAIFHFVQEAKPAAGKKAYDVSIDADEVPTCAVLRDLALDYYNANKKKYPKEMYRGFLTYWSEPNEHGTPLWYRTKMKKGSFRIAGRLATWFKIQKNFDASKPKPREPEKLSNSQIPEHLRKQTI